MRRTAIAAFLALQSAAPAFADGASIVEEMALKAMDRGYGATCSLEMKPVDRGGYYPCLDFGPYRFVKTYGKSHGFVVQADREPFLVLSGAAGGLGFLYDGPWQTDMPARMVMWWNEVVEGGAKAAKDASFSASEREAAEDYIRSLGGEPRQEAPAAPVMPPPVGAGTEEISPDIKDLLSAQ